MKLKSLEHFMFFVFIGFLFLIGFILISSLTNEKEVEVIPMDNTEVIILDSEGSTEEEPTEYGVDNE